MRYIVCLSILCGCGAQSAMIIEDIIDGEVKVIEHTVEDAAGIPHPQHPACKPN